MEKADTIRGYDDTINLRKMASGIFTREYGSVDEAAKAVLGEDGGSNVDRLRRKFREQNWHERGLSEYVEAEIARRGLISTPRHLRFLNAITDRFGFLRAKPSTAGLRNLDRRVRDAIAPKGSLVTALVATTLVLLAVFLGNVSSEHALVGLLACSFFGLVLWANKTSETADHETASRHVGILCLVTFSVVSALALLAPTSGYLVGSLYGTVALAVGMTSIGAYLTTHISATTRKSGQRKTFVVSALIWAIAVLSQSGTVLMVNDTLASRSLSALGVLASN